MKKSQKISKILSLILCGVGVWLLFFYLNFYLRFFDLDHYLGRPVYCPFVSECAVCENIKNLINYNGKENLMEILSTNEGSCHIWIEGRGLFGCIDVSYECVPKKRELSWICNPSWLESQDQPRPEELGENRSKRRGKGVPLYAERKSKRKFALFDDEKTAKKCEEIAKNVFSKIECSLTRLSCKKIERSNQVLPEIQSEKRVERNLRSFSLRDRNKVICSAESERCIASVLTSDFYRYCPRDTVFYETETNFLNRNTVQDVPFSICKWNQPPAGGTGK